MHKTALIFRKHDMTIISTKAYLKNFLTESFDVLFYFEINRDTIRFVNNYFSNSGVALYTSGHGYQRFSWRFTCWYCRWIDHNFVCTEQILCKGRKGGKVSEKIQGFPYLGR